MFIWVLIKDSSFSLTYDKKHIHVHVHVFVLLNWVAVSLLAKLSFVEFPCHYLFLTNCYGHVCSRKQSSRPELKPSVSILKVSSVYFCHFQLCFSIYWIQFIYGCKQTSFTRVVIPADFCWLSDHFIPATFAPECRM